MRFARRFLYRRLPALALAALCALALAGPAGARALEGLGDAPDPGVSLRLADAQHPPVGSPAGAPTASPTDSGSDVSTLALVLSLVGMGAVAAAGAAVLTTRLQRRQHGAV